MRICNEGLEEPVQLVSRLWVVKDFNGKEQRVRKRGVGGGRVQRGEGGGGGGDRAG